MNPDSKRSFSRSPEKNSEIKEDAMFFEILKKELKVYFSSKMNIVFMVILPLLFIGLFSVALKDYIGADYGTFDNGKVFYFMNTDDAAAEERFSEITERLEAASEVVFEQVGDLEQAKNDVEASKAYGVITVNADVYDYYRSPYNETEGGKLLRSMFVQAAENASTDSADYPAVIENTIELSINEVDSSAYYTFSALGFTLMMLSVGIAISIFDERENRTIERYRISKVGIGGMFAAKIIVGMIAGCIQFAISFAFSAFVLGVDWGDKIGWMLLLLMLDNLFAVLLAVLLGMRGKNKSISQDSVLLITMLSAYLGGSVTPVYLLENIPVLRWLVKISPLYWTNRALISLYNDILDEKTLYSAIILVGLSAVMTILIALGEKKKHHVRIISEKEEEAQA